MAINSESPNHETLEGEEDSENSPNKRPKTLSLNSPSSSKGKSKIEDESNFHSCGICLSEEGKAIRGWIDSCDHYFCFVCIMEWAKVESRCPMCKRRFAAIRRPPKDGVFPAERIVNVPVRDQVYHYFGNATTGPSDPYSEVQCTVCQCTSNESLLLLCDLCDSASHTYCVGLGATVPEGDWFCQDCTLLRDEHSKDDKDPDCYSQTGSDPNYDNQTKFKKFHQIPSAETRVSILDIVRESSLHEAERSSSNRSRLLSTVVQGGESVADSIIDHGSGKQSFVGCGASQLGARTLGHCRNVHGRIRALRENWNRFQQGSLSFSSNSDDKHGVGSVPHGRSGQPNSSSCSSQQLTPQKGSSCNVLPNSGTEDINKAWKMMDAAKSIEKDRRRTNIVHASKGSKLSLRKVNTPKEADSGSSNVLISSSIGNKNCDGLEKHYQDCAIVKTSDRHKYHMFKDKKPSGVPKLIYGYPATRSIFYPGLSSSTKVWSSGQVSIYGNGGNIPQNEFLGTLSNVLNKNDGSCSSVPVAENNSHAKQELHASSSSNLEEKNKVERSVDNKAKKDYNAKSEIQSLVKLNLKLLSRDKKLEVDAFKEVARLATHSILAVCGIGHPKPGVRSFPSSICSHVDEVEQVRRSTLMPSSCRECFFVFVKDVVNTIMLEKVGYPS